ncbi:MAG: hypothetical protein ACK4GC_02945 [Paracoccaceae bacterium]
MSQFQPLAHCHPRHAHLPGPGCENMHVLTHKGYLSGAGGVACNKAGIKMTLPRPETTANRSTGMYVKADFKYDAARDVCICPTGDELIYRYTRGEDGIHIGRY